MKVKLLKKLRHKFASKYFLRRERGGWGIWSKHQAFKEESLYHFPSLEEAKCYLIVLVRNDICDWIYKNRGLSKNEILYNITIGRYE